MTHARQRWLAERWSRNHIAGVCYILNGQMAFSLKILLIEDDADDAELTIMALRKFAAASPIQHIDDGEKALEFLFGTDARPSVVLLDLKMPRVDGIQILRRLKNDPDKRNIPVVALISSREGRHYVESFDLKADAYMIKPVDPVQFSTVLSEIGLTS